MLTIFEHKPGEPIPTEIPNPEARAKFLKECSKNGGIIPEGFPVYRGDTRAMSEISSDGGFVPSTVIKEGETLQEHAKVQAGAILRIQANEFIRYWKYSMTCPEEYKPLIKGAGGRLAGVSCGCGVTGSQKAGHEYEIKLPQLYALAASVFKSFRVCIYGDCPVIDDSTVFWMHLVQLTDAEEIVSLTAIPLDRITEKG